MLVSTNLTHGEEKLFFLSTLPTGIHTNTYFSLFSEVGWGWQVKRKHDQAVLTRVTGQAELMVI